MSNSRDDKETTFLSKTFKLFSDLQEFHPQDCPDLKIIEDTLALFVAKKMTVAACCNTILETLANFQNKKSTLLNPIQHSEKKFFAGLEKIVNEVNIHR